MGQQMTWHFHPHQSTEGTVHCVHIATLKVCQNKTLISKAKKKRVSQLSHKVDSLYFASNVIKIFNSSAILPGLVISLCSSEPVEVEPSFRGEKCPYIQEASISARGKAAPALPLATFAGISV